MYMRYSLILQLTDWLNFKHRIHFWLSEAPHYKYIDPMTETILLEANNPEMESLLFFLLTIIYDLRKKHINARTLCNPVFSFSYAFQKPKKLYDWTSNQRTSLWGCKNALFLHFQNSELLEKHSELLAK